MKTCFFLLDPSLADFAGHHDQYAGCVLNAANRAGYRAGLAANRRLPATDRFGCPTVAMYKYGYWGRAPAKFGRRGPPAQLVGRLRASAALGCARKLAQWRQRRQFVRDTRDSLGRLGAAPDDLIFVPSLSPVELAGLVQLLRAERRWCSLRWHLLLRRDVPTGKPLEALRRAMAALSELPARVHFWSDSETLADGYSRATGRCFGTLPIPHATPPVRAASHDDGHRQIAFLGDARREKGFHHLPAIVEALTNDGKDRGRFTFRFQAHTTTGVWEPEVHDARRKLKRLAGGGVTLFERPQEPAAYRTLLESSHVTLLPYDAAAYAARSSGVFAESLAAGVPVVVPAATWMASQLPPGAGRIYRDVSEVPALVRDLATRGKADADATAAWSGAWQRRHNAAALVKRLEGTSP